MVHYIVGGIYYFYPQTIGKSIFQQYAPSLLNYGLIFPFKDSILLWCHVSMTKLSLYSIIFTILCEVMTNELSIVVWSKNLDYFSRFFSISFLKVLNVNKASYFSLQNDPRIPTKIIIKFTEYFDLNNDGMDKGP